MSEGFGRLQEAFEKASSLPPPERAAYLDLACAGDRTLREEVERLLAAHERPGAILDRAPPETFASPPSEGQEAPSGLEGFEVGGYRIIRLIGEGGMGAVYEAVQREPQRRVALKVLHRGLSSELARRRFELEGRILASLHHPSIAQIHAAGVHRGPAGDLSYLAMELIEGERITDHARSRGLGIRERIALVIRVCEAVEHAHQKGVIHRDLKPANILVERSGDPKVLDFGIARATDADLQATTLATATGQLMGTVPYMSPEQAAGDPDRIDTRTDVYSLGVVLYELLAGRLPLDVREKPITEAVRIVREEEPSTLGSVDRKLQGDIETICAKALSKEPGRRYGSARELAEDLRRHLEDRPILARPPSAFYQMRKFAARNRALVAGAAAVLATLLLGIVGTGWQALRARSSEREALRFASSEGLKRKEAEEARARAEKVSAYILDLFSSITYEQRGSGVKVAEVLDDWAAGIDAALAGHPDIAVTLHNTIGSAYLSLGLLKGQPAEAAALLRQVLDIRTRFYGAENLGTLQAASKLAYALALAREFAESEALFESTLRAQEKYSRAAELFRRELEVRDRPPGTESAEILNKLHNLAYVLVHDGKHAEAKPLLERAMAMRERVLPAGHSLGAKVLKLHVSCLQALEGEDRDWASGLSVDLALAFAAANPARRLDSAGDEGGIEDSVEIGDGAARGSPFRVTFPCC